MKKMVCLQQLKRRIFNSGRPDHWGRSLFVIAMGGFLGSSLAMSPSDARTYRVVVDPGHGGSDHGATSGGISESQIVLRVGARLQERLKSDSRFAVFMTRTEDKGVSLFRRASLAIAEKADLFVSIHVNSSPDHTACGTEFYIQNQMPQDEESLFLAHRENAQTDDNEQKSGQSEARDLHLIIQDLSRPHATIQSHKFAVEAQKVWKADLPDLSTKIRQGPFYVLQAAVAPSLLVELGYISNPKEAKWLNSNEAQDKMAVSLYRAIEKFREIVDKKSSQGHITAHAFGRPKY